MISGSVETRFSISTDVYYYKLSHNNGVILPVQNEICIFGKPKLLGAEVKNSRVVPRIILPLLAKVLYKFGFF